MGTCRTCRWWGGNITERDPNDDAGNVRICTCPKMHHGKSDYGDDFDGPTVCVDSSTDSALESDEAAVADGSGYWAAFFPGPDFGCVHWELTERIDTLPVELRKRTAEEFRKAMRRQADEDPDGVFAKIIETFGGMDKFFAQWGEMLEKEGVIESVKPQAGQNIVGTHDGRTVTNNAGENRVNNAICTGYVGTRDGDDVLLSSLGFSTGSAIGFQTRRCSLPEAEGLIGKTFEECMVAIRVDSTLTPKPPSDNNLSGE